MEAYASAPLGNNAYYRDYYDAVREQAVAQALAQARRPRTAEDIFRDMA
jgi:hypothetical protein